MFGEKLSRRRVLQISGGALGTGLLSAMAAGRTPDEALAATAIDSFDGGAAPMIEPIGRYESGLFDEGGAEIVDYHPPTQRLFVINANLGGVDVLDIADPTDPAKIGELDVAGELAGVSKANSVSVATEVIAAALEADTPQDPGEVGFYDPETLEFLGSVTVGALPDKVTITPDERYALVANEGEPNEEYSVDPKGSVSIIDIADGVASASVETAGFDKYDGMEDELRDQGIRIFGPDASASQDFEPEYITVTDDSKTAWVSLQENNALAAVDIESAEVTDLLPLGYKDHSLAGNELDVSNEDGGVNIRNWPINGILQPDSIGVYSVGGETYIVTANEGDSRDYDGFSEEAEVGDLTLDPEGFDFDAIEGIDSVDELQQPENLGPKGVTTTLGDTDGDGVYEEIYVFGGRSFSIFSADGEQVFDSGSDFEQITAERFPENFNNDNNESDPDGRSDNKGPEPEGLTLGTVGDRHFAFIGLERIGGIMMYEITDPTAPVFIQYINERDFSVNIEAEIEDGDAPASAAGDLGPEGLTFVTAEESPIDDPLVVVGHEISGTTTVFRVATTVVDLPSVAIGHDKTATVDLTLQSAVDGLAGSRLTVSVDHPDVARISGASYPEAFSLTRTPNVSKDGSSVELVLADIEESVQPGAVDVPLATIDLVGTGTGTTDLTVEVEAFDDESGSPVDVLAHDGVVVTGPPLTPGSEGLPTDPDGDGFYEDINGNGRLDYDDIALLFREFDSDAIRLNKEAYDFNENGKLDYDDIVELYQDVQ